MKFAILLLAASIILLNPLHGSTVVLADGWVGQGAADSSWASNSSIVASALQVTGPGAKDDGGWSRTFAAVDWSIYTYAIVTARLESGMAPGVPITLAFEDEDLNQTGFITLSQDLFNPTTYSTAAVEFSWATWSGFDATRITSWRLAGGSASPTNDFRASIDTVALSTIPEPSTGLLIGMGSMAFLLLRRRKKLS